jgi:hypothetical protein
MELDMTLTMLGATLASLVAASHGVAGGGSDRFLATVHATVCNTPEVWHGEEQEGEEQRQQRTDNVAAALAACAEEVELTVVGDPRRQLNSIVRHPALSQRLTALRLRPRYIQVFRNAQDLQRVSSEAATALLAFATTTTTTTTTTQTTTTPTSRKGRAAAGRRRSQQHAAPPPACLLPVLQRVGVHVHWASSPAPLLAALARLRAPRLCTLQLRFLVVMHAAAAGAAAAAVPAEAAAVHNDPLLPAVLEALCSRQQPVDAQGQPTRLELHLGRGGPAVAAAVTALAGAARHVVEATGGRAAWLEVVEDE